MLSAVVHDYACQGQIDCCCEEDWSNGEADKVTAGCQHFYSRSRLELLGSDFTSKTDSQGRG